MRKCIFIIIAAVLMGIQATAQYNFKFIGEGTGQQVKLLWLPEKWYEGMDGVVIKRREISKGGVKKDWVSLTETAIHPGNWLEKDLSNVSNSANRVNDLKTLRIKLLNNTKQGSTQLKDIKENYLKNELKTPESVKSLILMFSFDYDLALLTGFGYVDTQYPKSDKLEYGIFPVINGTITNNAVKTFEYKIGNEPDLGFIVKKSKIKRKNRVVNLKWTIDNKDLRKKENLIGFNIYRKSGDNDFLKISNTTIWIDKKGDDGSLMFSDTIPDENGTYLYGVAAISIFKNEGKKYEIACKSQNDSEDLRPPIIKCNNEASSDYVKEGVLLEWTFKMEQEPSITGFVLERKLKPEDGFTVISDTLSLTTRKYLDNKVPAPKSEYYIYRVSAVREETFPLLSNQLLLFYHPRKKIAKPASFMAVPEIIDNTVFIHLKWNGPSEILNSIQGYAILCDRAWGTLAREAGIPLVRGFDYKYKVEGVSGIKYLFAIAPVDNDGIMTQSSDTLSVMVPSLQLPNIKIWPIESKDKKVTFYWKYPSDIPDLEGFRIYQNGVLVVNETVVKAVQRSWTSLDLEAGKYSYKIEAVTTFKILSKQSDERYINIK